MQHWLIIAQSHTYYDVLCANDHNYNLMRDKMWVFNAESLQSCINYVHFVLGDPVLECIEI